jgi:hypothetical protein
MQERNLNHFTLKLLCDNALGNAALLYYQAFLLRPEPNEAIKRKMYVGTDPDRQIRTYLGHCLPVIEIVETASRMPGCIWGVRTEHGLSVSDFASQIGPLQDILLVDAQTLAADGHYRVALERCLTVRRIARQLAEDPELYILSTGVDEQSLSAVRHVLGAVPPDVDILTWFRGQFAVIFGGQSSLARELQAYVKAALNHIRTHPARLARLRNLLVEAEGNERSGQNARRFTNEELISCAGEGLQRLIDSLCRIVDSEMTYEQKRAEMQRLISELGERDAADLVTKDIVSADNLEGLIDLRYPYQVVHQAQVNGVKAAVEVYLVLAKTGRLPEKLPYYLPKDPFTGGDFVYEKTKEGFALRCRDEDFQRYKRWLEFKVRK